MKLAVLKVGNEVQEEPVSESFVPYVIPVSDSVIKTDSGDYVAFIQIGGVAFESASPGTVNGWFDQFHNFLRNIAKPDIAVHTHVLRVKNCTYPDGDFTNEFANNLNEKYRSSVTTSTVLENRLYLSIIYRPNNGTVAKAFSLFERVNEAEQKAQNKYCLDYMNDLASTALMSLYAFEPKLLSVVELDDVEFSEPLKFLNYLINNEWQQIGIPTKAINKMLPSSRLMFGSGGTIASKGATKVQYMTALGLLEYPARVKATRNVIKPTVFDQLLKAPYEFTLSQSFCFVNKGSSISLMNIQQGQKNVANDAAKRQIAAIDDAKEGVDGNDFIFGQHSFVLLVKADSKEALDDNINHAGSVLSDTGAKWMREDLASDAAFFSILPGNFKYRINVNPISSMNFACLSSYHNFPSGRTESQWGNPVTMFKTTAGGSYLFNFHDSDDGKIDTTIFEPASTLIVGKVGTGKTVTLAFLLTQLQKFRTKDKKLSCALFDRGMGLSIVVRALGGMFYPLKLGVRSGFQPMQLDPTERNIDFMNSLIKQLVRHESYPILPIEDKAIAESVAGVIATPKHLRTLTAVMQHLRGKVGGDANGIAERLAKWCKGGKNGWLLDNDEDTLNVDYPVIGFDVDEFLENEEIKTATMLYLMHRVKSLMDGRRVVNVIDEFGVLLDDGASGEASVWSEMAEKGIVTARKMDSFYILVAQDTQQILRSKTAYALINQTSTKIFLPNPSAKEADYMKGFDLTREEYTLIRNLPERSRKFLIKQGHKSVVAELNLKGFDDELAVLSGNVRTSALVENIIKEVGNDPKDWLPIFHNRRKSNEN